MGCQLVLRLLSSIVVRRVEQPCVPWICCGIPVVDHHQQRASNRTENYRGRTTVGGRTHDLRARSSAAPLSSIVRGCFSWLRASASHRSARLPVCRKKY